MVVWAYVSNVDCSVVKEEPQQWSRELHMHDRNISRARIMFLNLAKLKHPRRWLYLLARSCMNSLSFSISVCSPYALGSSSGVCLVLEDPSSSNLHVKGGQYERLRREYGPVSDIRRLYYEAVRWTKTRGVMSEPQD